MRPYIPFAYKSSYHWANPKVQYSKFNVQSQSPYMPVIAELLCKMAEIVLCKHATHFITNGIFRRFCTKV